MITIDTLDKISTNDISTAFSEAFKNYEVQISKEELLAMLQRRGFVPQLSFGAFDRGKLVSFTLNGIGTYNGIKTAYDTGTGTLEAYRGKGLASMIFKTAVPVLKEAGINQYLLEVLQNNQKAVSVYKNLHFKVIRELNYFTSPKVDIRLNSSKLPDKVTLKTVTVDQLKLNNNFWDFTPSWQNSFESINRCLDNFRIFGAFYKEKLLGYGVFEPGSGDITQIAVNKTYRRQGIGTSLLNEMIKISQSSSIKVINAEISCTEMLHFLEANNILLKGKQFEMIKQL